jgi:Tetratricopeptide repeat
MSRWPAMLVRAAELRDRGEYEAALAAARRAVNALVRDVDPDNTALAQVLTVLGRAEADLGRYAEAERILRRAGAAADGSSGPARLRANTALAGIFRVQGRYSEAEALFRRTLAEAEVTLGPDDNDVADILNDLGITLKYSGGFDEAERLYEIRSTSTTSPRPPTSAATPRRPSRSTGESSRSSDRCSAATTPGSRPRSTTWPCSSPREAGTPRPVGSSGGRSTSSNAPSRRTIRSSSPAARTTPHSWQLEELT